ncbi:hypothetical protein EGR_06725 [Echinococcus granulosus]|uniref:Uncharacterized protein n=1 Tax=Echinococcus granulosus TaxID=6210 RepID=W6UAQ1_ECHGR|nr:hypothetical protein EGR_06725 [Echinococcus granulosus]EUB58438.1 hypothetical protein EGR_06725 [Echinococcus granulosus]
MCLSVHPCENVSYQVSSKILIRKYDAHQARLGSDGPHPTMSFKLQFMLSHLVRTARHLPTPPGLIAHDHPTSALLVAHYCYVLPGIDVMGTRAETPKVLKPQISHSSLLLPKTVREDTTPAVSTNLK